MSQNVVFSYLYRDAANNKAWSRLVLTNPSNMSINEVEERLRLVLESENLFVADQVRVQEVFHYLSADVTEDDHSYHEFESVESTEEAPNDVYGRSISQFVEEVEAVARTGWRIFDPEERMQ